ncbi:MAG: hypothetical protein JWP96_1630 [Polaromonas sp.]|nr:hypothetical protein [Polaromonas sp.]
MSQQQNLSPKGSGGETAANPAVARAASPDSQVNLDSESVAGEEDPGASMDMAGGSSSNPSPDKPFSAPSGAVNPGDEAPAGTPGTGENICRECGGSGRVDGAPCVSCGGSGKVIVGVGGA